MKTLPASQFVAPAWPVRVRFAAGPRQAPSADADAPALPPNGPSSRPRAGVNGRSHPASRSPSPAPPALGGRREGALPASIAWGGRRRGSRAPAFSLIEILVAIGLLSVIVLGLVAMYDRTQSVFKSGLTQTDVLESGRALVELMGRELEQIAPASVSNVVNFSVDSPPVAPMTQLLPPTIGAGQRRTNVVQELYFVTEENRRWTATGYRVANPLGGVGSLYRFQSPPVHAMDLPLMYAAFVNAPLTHLNRVADGVVHFRVRTFDPLGMVVGLTNGVPTIPPAAGAPMLIQPGPTAEDADVAFWSNAVPARVELEIGVLEPRVAETARQRPTAAAQRQYLLDKAGAVHLFRIRVPVRNVQPAAYP